MRPFLLVWKDTGSPRVCTLSLHDALPISKALGFSNQWYAEAVRTAKSISFEGSLAIRLISAPVFLATKLEALDRKSTRLNSSHVEISYAVFCLKKKNVERVIYVCGRCAL